MISSPLSEQLRQLRQFVHRHLRDVHGCHGFDHVERVCQLAEWLGKRMNARLDVLLPAAWLHDVGHAATDNASHHEASLRTARELLPTLGFAPETVQAILTCIAEHRFSSGRAPSTLESQILSDADKLDALGAIGIARAFAFCGEHGRDLADGVQHFHDKLLRLERMMHTPPAQRLARRRTQFMRLFLERFAREAVAEE
ncbi:MAG: HD domain-containing protein [Abditibacteriales bacterium]|nr:HD domain-containing protein [Abditibacteriales bacterium]MDW8365262.1 HD domain-containing protein [Abditibacteriales bacterium]